MVCQSTARYVPKSWCAALCFVVILACMNVLVQMYACMHNVHCTYVYFLKFERISWLSPDYCRPTILHFSCFTIDISFQTLELLSLRSRFNLNLCCFLKNAAVSLNRCRSVIQQSLPFSLQPLTLPSRVCCRWLGPAPLCLCCWCLWFWSPS